MRKLNDWLEGFLRFTEGLEPPTIYKKWVGISVIASVLKRKCSLTWGSLKFYPNMYIVLVGPAGRTRKGTAMDPGYHLLRDIGINMAAEATTRESLIQELRRSEDVSVDPKGKTMLHSSLTIFSKELTVFLGVQNNQLIMDLTDWFDCKDRWIYRTKNAGTDEIVGVYVNMIGATTPHALRVSLPRDAIGGGLTSRIVFVYADKKGKIVANPDDMESDLQLYNDLLNDLQAIHSLQGEFYPTKKFVDLWVDWYESQEEADLFPGVPELDSYVERRPTHLLKLSMIISASRRESMELRREDLEAGIMLLNEVEESMPRVFAGVGQADNAEVSAAIIEYVAKKEKVAARDIYHAFFRDVGSKKEFFDLLTSLEYSGAIKITYLDGGDYIIKKGDRDDYKRTNFQTKIINGKD